MELIKNASTFIRTIVAEVSKSVQQAIVVPIEETNVTDKLCKESIENDGHLQAVTTQVQRKQTRVRRSYKKLTTCKVCGHFRFAMRNNYRVVNPNYPYEHEKGKGCNVPIRCRILPGYKLRNYCSCIICIDAAKYFFVERNIISRKKTQYLYSDAVLSKSTWAAFKAKGWYRYGGRYFPPEMRRTEKGFPETFVRSFAANLL